MSGCGNSRLTEDMFEDGKKNYEKLYILYFINFLI